MIAKVDPTHLGRKASYLNLASCANSADYGVENHKATGQEVALKMIPYELFQYDKVTRL